MARCARHEQRGSEGGEGKLRERRNNCGDHKDSGRQGGSAEAHRQRDSQQRAAPLRRLSHARNRSAGASNIQHAQTVAIRVPTGRRKIDDGKCGASSSGGGEADLWLANGSGQFFRPPLLHNRITCARADCAHRYIHS